jgi:hypothetical protein
MKRIRSVLLFSFVILLYTMSVEGCELDRIPVLADGASMNHRANNQRSGEILSSLKTSKSDELLRRDLLRAYNMSLSSQSELDYQVASLKQRQEAIRYLQDMGYNPIDDYYIESVRYFRAVMHIEVPSIDQIMQLGNILKSYS